MNKKLSISVPYQIVAKFGPDARGDNGKDEVRYLCPECQYRHGSPDTKGKLYINTKTFKYHCFRCGYSGQIGKEALNPDHVYQENEEQDLTDLVHEIDEVENGKDRFQLKIPLAKVGENDKAVKYLLDRGFTTDQMEYYDMRTGNLNCEFGRIIIPNEVKKLVYTDFYSARTYIGQVPKYHNPRVEKSDIVFNLFRIKENSPIIVVEGALTAIAAGYHAVATLGKTMSKNQASQIVAKNPSVIYLNYDYNAEEYSHNACRLLRSLSPDIPIYEVIMTDDRDAADLTHEEYTECLNRAKLYNPLYEDLMGLIN